MKASSVLKKNNLIPRKYETIGKVSIVDTNLGKYVVKYSKIDKDILDYLNSRAFDYMPNIINDEEDISISEYVEDFNIPKEQKILDLANLTALLHSKTTHYKEIDQDEYEQIYEDINNNIEYLYSYYNDIISIIEMKVFMSPSEYLLARNISFIYQSLNKTKILLNEWHKVIKEKRKQRNVVLHNNLKLSHFIRNENSYLISWEKAKIGNPVFDLYKLYKNHVLDFDFQDVLDTYEKSYPLLSDEKQLFYILISLPDIIDFKDTEYNNCQKISDQIDTIYKSAKITKSI